MPDPYVGEIMLFAGAFPPRGWAFCDGQLLPISQNTALFSLLGNAYGGDGEETFALPDLRGRVPMQHGQGPGLSSRTIGQPGGEEAQALATSEMPSHNHRIRASSAAASTTSPDGAVYAKGGAYAAAPDSTSMDPEAIAPQSGAGAAHHNMQPFQVATYIIALQGIYPPRG